MAYCLDSFIAGDQGDNIDWVLFTVHEAVSGLPSVTLKPYNEDSGMKATAQSCRYTYRWRYNQMLDYERDLWSKGLSCIAGIDEVGRGCLFGDVVAAAVILPAGLELEGVNDSKKLSEKKREQLYHLIMEQALAVGIGEVDAATIDRINIKQASRLAMKLALEQASLAVAPDYLLIDAEKVDSSIPQLAIIHGDALSQSIAAASIIAKVTRDRKCLYWDSEFPEYGIGAHKGYATKVHRAAILEYGASPLHRRSFLGKIINVQDQLF